ncbi:MAG: glycosyltransferase family 4 protein [Verrucomicrobiae bacterium]|nr:glycosyltransferase family 4 protein [Verrucomicrobiae bacterium]
MRARVVGHAYVAQDNRAKWESLARERLAEIELLLPHRWPSWERDYRPESSEAPGLRVRVARAFRVGREDQYFFAPGSFGGMANFDLLCVEQGTTAAVFAQALLARRGTRTRACFFTWINWEGRHRRLWRAIERFNFARSDGAVGGNRDAVDLLRKHGFRGKTAVLPQLGVDTDFYSSGSADSLRARLGLEGFVLGFVGRLVPEKGVLDLIEAAAAFRDVAGLLLVGDGPLAADARERADALGLRLVHVPAVPHDAVRDHLRAMDALVLPSRDTPRWREQFGHVLIEAMACEVPVVGSTAGAIPEVLGEAGLLFSEGNREELRERIAALLASPSERRAWGRRGRVRVLAHYTHAKVARDTLAFWETLR